MHRLDCALGQLPEVHQRTGTAHMGCRPEPNQSASYNFVVTRMVKACSHKPPFGWVGMPDQAVISQLS
jgi:hypothetical protein